MKFTSHSKAHEIPTPIKLDSTEQPKPKIKLTYNGNTFDYIPRPVVVSEEDTTDWPTVTLIYRANIFERKLPPPSPTKSLVLLTGVGNLDNYSP